MSPLTNNSFTWNFLQNYIFVIDSFADYRTLEHVSLGDCTPWNWSFFFRQVDQWKVYVVYSKLRGFYYEWLEQRFKMSRVSLFWKKLICVTEPFVRDHCDFFLNVYRFSERYLAFNATKRAIIFFFINEVHFIVFYINELTSDWFLDN